MGGWWLHKSTGSELDARATRRAIIILLKLEEFFDQQELRGKPCKQHSAGQQEGNKSRAA